MINTFWRNRFRKNGSNERVQLSLVQGKKYHDRELWCGSGLKYEGLFSISVLFSDGRRVEITLNSFWDKESFFSFPGPGPISFADYNHDGVLDSNLGQYASCNGSAIALESGLLPGFFFGQ